MQSEANHNQFTYSVSEISFALKRMVEDNFGHVRIRGEISGWKLATSGHAYLKLKDENSLLDAVCWKGVVGKLGFRPEDGIEVICSGKLTTYPGRSNYQLVIDSIEISGAGALMALLEKRKQMLAAEGLFEQSRKKKLPFMPQNIGVVTSPTGAVIRDILHRLSDRFPCHVLVWGVAVQGEGAAEQIAAAINGFNAMENPPELIIVARGGGSLEDLWAFNEEVVVRAAAASKIPLISAVGHETDTTLIDYASDLRAPTPTAAAEIAVSVRDEWILSLMDIEKRMLIATKRNLQAREDKIIGLARGLPNPEMILGNSLQRFDDRSERLESALTLYLSNKSAQITLAASKLRDPQAIITAASQQFTVWQERLNGSLENYLSAKSQQVLLISSKLNPAGLLQNIVRYMQEIDKLSGRMPILINRNIAESANRLENMQRLLAGYSVKNVLERGFALVRDSHGKLIKRLSQTNQSEILEIEFFDGKVSR